MSYKLKTLIVFDTNSLRSTEAGDVAYSFFAFGKPFQVIEDFINEKNLSSDIHIAIPSWAIEELKDQKHKKYKEDIAEFQRLAKRLSGLPHIPKITLPEEEFDCATYVSEKADAFIATKTIKLLEIKEDAANSVLRSMMSRVMRNEGKQAPFIHTGKNDKIKDAGFKDNIVWESLMNFEEVENYDKVIFLTNDSGFNEHCKVEFVGRWGKHISILSNENNLLAEIQLDFREYLEFSKIDSFARTEYFIGKLNEEITKYKWIQTADPGTVWEVSIKDPCKAVQRIPPTDDIAESILVTSIISVMYEQNDDLETLDIELSTVLADEESKEIIEMIIDQRLQ